jgi:TRAP-type C4-dicarboxylate transport system substrate-binding protein
MHRRPFLLALLALALALVPGVAPGLGQPSPVGAQATGTTLRVATLPRGSAWHRVFSAWAVSLRTQTGGQLTLQLEETGPGDEAALVRRMRAGDLDGASFTAVGIGEIARPVLALQAPGVIDSYAQLDRARTALDGQLRTEFEQNGVTLLGWSDYGQARIFSTRPIMRPADLAQAHPWVLANDPIFSEFLRVIGAVGVPLPISGVRAALESGRVDTVVASATAISGLQLHTRLRHVTQDSNAILIGATLFSKSRVDALPPALQQALRDTGDRAHAALRTAVRRDDERYYELLVSRHGLSPVNASQHAAEWQRAAQTTRERLVGRLYSREQLDRAIAAAGAP